MSCCTMELWPLACKAGMAVQTHFCTKCQSAPQMRWRQALPWKWTLIPSQEHSVLLLPYPVIKMSLPLGSRLADYTGAGWSLLPFSGLFSELCSDGSVVQSYQPVNWSLWCPITLSHKILFSSDRHWVTEFLKSPQSKTQIH